MKILSVATDIYDEFHHTGRFYTPQHLRDLMAYNRSLGATTIDWIVDDMWALYDDYPGGMDLLRTAIDAAHAEGLEFSAVYKPFEGALSGIILPHSAPRPAGSPVWDGLQGLIPVIRPIAAEHPEYCLQRRPSDADPGGSLRELRLIKNDDAPFALDPAQVSLWTSATNGRLTRWEASFTIDSALAWRPLFPLGQTCRVLTLSGLDIPASQRFIELRFADDAFAGQPFRNDYDVILEAVNEAGAVIPIAPAAADHPRSHYARQLAKPPFVDLVRYARHPEVRAFLGDDAALEEHCRDLAAYGREPGSREYALDQRRQFAFARGKEPYLRGILNPVYPEVREHWLAQIRHFIDCGADKVDLRASSHLNQQEQWAYGFNEPVLRELGGDENVAGACRVMGEAYTGFLREARDLLHAHGRLLGVHLMTNFVKTRDEGAAKPAHEIMDWEWETWVAEIADSVVIRGAMGLRWESLQYTVDLFGDACRRRGIPAIYQSNRRAYTGLRDALHLHPDRLKALEYEMAYALNHPCIAGFQYYETANFTTLDDRGTFRGSDEMRELSRRFGLIEG